LSLGVPVIDAREVEVLAVEGHHPEGEAIDGERLAPLRRPHERA